MTATFLLLKVFLECNIYSTSLQVLYLKNNGRFISGLLDLVLAMPSTGAEDSVAFVLDSGGVWSIVFTKNLLIKGTLNTKQILHNLLETLKFVKKKL